MEDSDMVQMLTKQSAYDITLPCFDGNINTYDIKERKSPLTVKLYGIRPLDEYTDKMLLLPQNIIEQVLRFVKDDDAIQKTVSLFAEKAGVAWGVFDKTPLLIRYEKDGDAPMLLCTVPVCDSITSPDADILSVLLSILKPK